LKLFFYFLYLFLAFAMVFLLFLGRSHSSRHFMKHCFVYCRMLWRTSVYFSYDLFVFSHKSSMILGNAENSVYCFPVNKLQLVFKFFSYKFVYFLRSYQRWVQGFIIRANSESPGHIIGWNKNYIGTDNFKYFFKVLFIAGCKLNCNGVPGPVCVAKIPFLVSFFFKVL